MKLAYFEKEKMPIKLIVGVYDEEANVLIEDLKNKYGLGDLLDKHQVLPKTIRELAKGTEYDFHNIKLEIKIKALINNFVILEFGFDYSNISKSTCQNINNLILAIRKLSTEDDHKWILFIDEVQIHNDHYNMLDLKVEIGDVHILMAINPISINCNFKYQLEIPSNEPTLHMQLLFKYRCSFEISVFLMHLKEYNQESTAKILDDVNDRPLDQSTFKTGRLPIWIFHNNIFACDVIDEIKQHIIESEDKTVTLLYNKTSLTGYKFEIISMLCNANKWNMVEHTKMTGSESSVVIHYEVDAVDPEAYSRSKNLLIIVTKYVYSFQLFLL